MEKLTRERIIKICNKITYTRPGTTLNYFVDTAGRHDEELHLIIVLNFGDGRTKSEVIWGVCELGTIELASRIINSIQKLESTETLSHLKLCNKLVFNAELGKVQFEHADLF